MAAGLGAEGEITNGHKEETLGGYDYVPYLGCDKGLTDVHMSKYQMAYFKFAQSIACQLYLSKILNK